jgi:hypothetical protein
MRFLIGFALVLCVSQSAFAGPAEDLASAQQQVFDAWQNMPLTQRKVLFLTAPSTGYGLYNQKDSNVFKPDEKIFTYVEPIGYGWKHVEGGLFEMNFIADLTIKSATGDVLLEKKAFATNMLQSHEQNMEFTMDYTLTLTGVPAGKYTLEYTLHDMSSKQDSTFDQDIQISD